MIKFPKIEQFRNVVKEVQDKATFVRYDEETNTVIRDKNANLPTLKFKGTVKLHGTNASVVLTESGDIVPQSRNRTLSLESDNAGFAWFVEQNKNQFKSFLTPYQKNNSPVVVYGEWCGSGIQKGVAISELPKMFVLFALRIGEAENTEWVEDFNSSPSIADVYNINQFQTWEMDIDFNKANLFVNDMIDITEAVEKECPVGKFFNVSGVGEGVVWKCVGSDKYTSLRFKVKGDKHSSSKVKKLASVDVEKMNSISEFVESVVTGNRVRQGVEYLIEQGKSVTIKQTGDVVRWVIGDVMVEEKDTLITNGLEPKDVNASIGKRTSKLFHELLDKNEFD